MPQLDLHRALTDFPYYSESLLKIKTKDARLIPFKLWEPQQKLQALIDRLISEGELPRIVCLKARQEGISTYSEGRIFWRSHLNENTRSVVITHEKESGASIFGMCRLFYDCLPKQLRPMTRYASKKELVFENPDAKTRDQNPGLRSSIEVYTAGKKNVARSTFTHNLHCSELGSWTFPEDVVPALMPTIPLTPDHFVMFESTAKGVGNFFHNEWLRASEGESNFTPFFLAWYDLPMYSKQFRTPDQKQAFSEKLDDEERELQNTFSLALEQLYWRRLEINDLGGDVDLFRQEYPATPSEAFIISGTPVFDRKKLRLMAVRCIDPRWRGFIDFNGKLYSDTKGALKVWQWPEKAGIYSIGVDVSEGGGRDYSCIQIWRKLPSPLTAEQVACWHGHIDAVALGEMVIYLAKFYNEAQVAVESNGPGALTLQRVIKDHWNVYQQEDFDSIAPKRSKKLGWLTTSRSKKVLISYMTHCISDMAILIHDQKLIDECTAFIKANIDVAGAAAGSGYDDRVMAAMIGLFTMHQAINTEPDDFQISGLAPAISTNPNKSRVDVDFDSILAMDGPDFEETWLNY